MRNSVSMALLAVVAMAGCKSKSQQWSGPLSVSGTSISSIGCRPDRADRITLYGDPSGWSIDLEPFEKDTGWNVIVNPPSGNADYLYKKDCTTFDIGFDDKSTLSGHFKVDCGSRLKADVTFTKCRE